jgi:phage replication-related protein YjqB (UPF0714/DUF867 family)
VVGVMNTPVTVAPATGRPDLISHREHCSVDPDTLATIGRSRWQQVRIVRGSERAIYTVTDDRPEPTPGVVRMGQRGRERLGRTDGFTAGIDPQVPRSDLSDHDAELACELVERLDGGSSRIELIAIAPHGGEIEPHTDEQAERVAAALGVSTWRCRGFSGAQGAVARWHITSAEIDPRSFPLLGSIMSCGFVRAVAFHGMNDPGVLVGGRASLALQAEIAAEIAGATGVAVRIAEPDDVLGGNAPANIVNLLTADGCGGVQIEQSAQVRRDHWAEIADAVAAVYARHLG